MYIKREKIHSCLTSTTFCGETHYFYLTFFVNTDYEKIAILIHMNKLYIHSGDGPDL